MQGMLGRTQILLYMKPKTGVLGPEGGVCPHKLPGISTCHVPLNNPKVEGEPCSHKLLEQGGVSSHPWR